MILQALKEYYDRKAADPDSGIAPPGWERKEIKYIVVLDKSGAVINIQNTQEGTGKQKRVKSFMVPQGIKRSAGVASNLLWDNPEYVLGLTLKEAKKSKDGRSSGEIKHEAFCEKIEILGDVNDAGLTAVRAFIALSLEEKTEQLKKCQEWEALLKDGAVANMTFKLAGQPNLVCSSAAVKKRINELALLRDSEEKGVCLISGEEEPIENLHPAIKGVWGGQSAGTNIVNFNLPAFCSFGKKQGANAPVGKSSVFAYVTALNTMLGKDSPNRMQIGEASTVFWSEKPSTLEENIGLLLSESEDDPEKGIKAVRALFDSPKSGEMAVQAEDEKDIRFYVLGLSPNAARLAIRFWINSTVGEMEGNLRKHFQDLDVDCPQYEIDRNGGFLSVFRLLVNIAVQGKSENIPPNIEGDLMQAILEGRAYPRTLFIGAIRRIRAEREVNYPRAAIVKAYLNRNRFELNKINNTNYKEITVSLDKENDNIGYCLGRLFAVLEKLQSEANPGINATIRDRFYGAASGTPITVFPNLMRLMGHHLSKLDNPGRVVNLEKLFGEILDKVPAFPNTLTMEDQGNFAIGYYHQKQDFYKTTAENKAEKENAAEAK